VNQGAVDGVKGGQGEEGCVGRGRARSEGKSPGRLKEGESEKWREEPREVKGGRGGSERKRVRGPSPQADWQKQSWL